MADKHLLARDVAAWLQSKGCTVSLVNQGTEVHVHYTLRLDVKPQPAVRITDKPSIVFPQGSQEDVVLAFLTRGL